MQNKFYALIIVGILTIAFFVIGVRPYNFGLDLGATTTDSCPTVKGSSSVHLAGYDRQMALMFGGNFSSLSYNVTAINQNDTFGYGPIYFLSGLSSDKYWYQVGLAWNVANGNFISFVPGFTILFQVWSPNGTSVFPSANGALEVPLARVVEGDKVQLSLLFSQDGNVTMEAYDWNTGVSENSSYYSFGSTSFVGTDKAVGAFTGLMTEWYQACAGFVGNRNVTYWSDSTRFSSGLMCIDEWNQTVTNSTNPYGFIMFSSCSSLISYSADPSTIHIFSVRGIISYSNANEFITD